MSDYKVVYKIRHKPSGMFSTGGSNPRFKKNGKTWETIGGLKAHLNMSVGGYRQSVDVKQDFRSYRDCEVVEFRQVITEEPMDFDVVDYINGKIEAEAKYREQNWRGVDNVERNFL